MKTPYTALTSILNPRVKVDLTGCGFNSLAIVGRIMSVMRKSGWSLEEQLEFKRRAMDGDRMNFVRVCKEYTDWDGKP